MSKSHSLAIKVAGNPGPASHYLSDQMNMAVIEVWKTVPDTLGSLRLDTGCGPVLFSADWEAWSKAVVVGTQETNLLYSSAPANQKLPVLAKILSPKSASPALEIEISGPQEIERVLRHVGEVYLSFVFLALNLAAPGCADFWGLRIVEDEMNDATLGYSNDLLAGGWEEGLRLGWPPIAQLGLSQVVEWLITNEFFKGQVACSRQQRVIYALLNLCRAGEAGPPEAIWLAHAMEALIDSPSSRINALLKDRLFLLLGSPGRSSRSIRKLLDGFYNLRSRIVHGDFNVCHPAWNEVLDKKVNDYRAEFSASLSFASAIVVSALQMMILEKWSEVSFEEKLVPKVTPPENSPA
jgi:hypothetical protein